MKKLISVKLDEIVLRMMLQENSPRASVLLKKSHEGTGIIAGGPARTVCELASITNIHTKSLGSQQQTERCTCYYRGSGSVKIPEEVARLHGKSVEEILG